ncbi:T9SS-dependent M36 family metallopeptidase [Hanstruepera flava]|uniref:T9SS-dependent M36 family metallopeptidase n=1 Tax=Hanstruepera flava TaxID=2930218 RepID=UPI002027FD8B|nr:T9SS-dependent M36 family metallopeptidase [Hanstruepera flava]
MKNNYINSVLFLVIALLTNLGFAQSNLTNSEYGSVIQSYLDQKKESLNLVSSDIADLYVSKEFFSTKSKLTHVYVNQRYQGINIFNAISSIAIKDNVVFYYANNFMGNIAQRVNAIAPQLSPEQAIQRAASELNLGSAQNLTLLETAEKRYVYTNGNISKVNIPVELVYYNSNGELKLAWDVSIYSLDGTTWPSVRIDALNGEVLSQNDWILTCNFGDANHISHNHVEKHNVGSNNFSLFRDDYRRVDGSQYNIYAIPVGGPNDGDRTLVSEPANPNASPFGWHDTNGVSGPEYTVTRGNNVWAQEDRDANNDDNGYMPDGTASLNFDFPLNLNQAPALYEDVSLTNLFYMNNMMHDVWYEYGFDEASGNFQENNYGNGGIGNDFVFADGQDGAGLNNATFGTPPDGGNPGMTMFLWSASGPAGDPLTINNGSLSGDYAGLPANFGGTLSSTPITADLALVVDNNIGGMSSTDPQDGCNNITNGADLNGKIVVIRRGVCEFGFKILAAENEGAVAVIMVNNVAGDPITMGGGAVGANVTIPSIMINNIDGEALIAALLNGDTINASLLDAGPYQKDGSLDNLIVAHEYGHGISNRLTGGANTTNCLTNITQMGEGWSDWFALMLTMKTTDLPEDPKGMATYSVGQNPEDVGIRRYPYSTDFAINPFTYGDTNDTSNSIPHGVGTIWATVLWDLTWAYVDKYGFDEDFLNGTGGNNKVMQIVMDGLKLQQCNPGFVDGRDAILAADNALTGGEDQCLIWEVFANRGLGLNASEGTPFSRTDQVEDFTMPPDSDPSLANCTSLSVDEFNQNDYKVYPNPTNGNVYIKTNRSLGEVRITLTDLNGRQVYSTQTELYNQVEINMSQLQSGIYILNINGQSINSNNKIIKN